MYEIRSDYQSIKAQQDQIVAIIESINNPLVAAAGKPLEPAKVYIMGVRNPSGSFSIYIYLHLLQSKECLIYLHDPPEVSRDDYHETEMEALQFVESMGFMVDNTNFRKMSPEHQSALLARLPMFYEDLEEFARRMSGDEESGEGEAEQGDVDLAPLEEGVIELNEDAVVETAPAKPQPVVSREGLAKIAKMLSSF